MSSVSIEVIEDSQPEAIEATTSIVDVSTDLNTLSLSSTPNATAATAQQQIGEETKSPTTGLAEAVGAFQHNVDEDEDDEQEFHDIPDDDEDDYDEGNFAESIEKNLVKADDAKERGNKLYLQQKYNEALDCYAEAVMYCPDNEDAKLVIYHSNKGAAHLMLEQYDEVISETSVALRINPKFVKALQRRAKAFETLKKYSDALEDYKTLASIDPTDRSYKERVASIDVLSKAQFEEQKGEMLGKLKDLGNGLLGKFGLSLDNFKAVQDPSTGSYNISFSQ